MQRGTAQVWFGVVGVTAQSVNVAAQLVNLCFHLVALSFDRGDVVVGLRLDSADCRRELLEGL